MTCGSQQRGTPAAPIAPRAGFVAGSLLRWGLRGSLLGLHAACSPPATRVAPPGPPDAAPVHVCQLADWKDAAQLPLLRLGHAGTVNAAALSPGHQWVATEGPDGNRLWELPAGRLVRTELPGITFCDDDHVVGLHADTVVSLELSSGAVTSTPRSDADLLSPDGCQLAHSAPDALRFVDTRTGREIESRRSEPVRLEASPVDALFDVVRGEHHETWTWARRRRVDPLTTDGQPRGELTLSTDGNFLCEVGFKGARVIDLAKGDVAFERRTTGDAGSFSSGLRIPTVSACELDRDGGRVAIVAIRPHGFRGFAPSDHRISVLNLRGKVLAAFDRVGVMRVAFSDDSRSLQIETRPGLDGRSDHCERVDLASEISSSCEPPAAARADGVTVEPNGRASVKIAGQAYTFDTVRTWDRELPAASPVGESTAPPRLMVRSDGAVSHLVELPSLRWRATVPTQREPLWVGPEAVLFSDGPGRLIGYRLEGCSVMRIAGLRVGATRTFVAATQDVLQADDVARTFLVGDPRPVDAGLVARFLMAP